MPRCATGRQLGRWAAPRRSRRDSPARWRALNGRCAALGKGLVIAVSGRSPARLGWLMLADSHRPGSGAGARTARATHRIPLFRTLLAYADECGPAAAAISYPVAQQLICAGRGLGCAVRTGTAPGQRPVLRASSSLREARVQLVNPGNWHASLLMALHQNVTITGYAGGVAGVLTGVIDAIVVAGSPQGYEDLAPLPVILAEAGAMVTDLSGGPVLSGPGTALISTGQRHEELLDLVAGLPHGQQQS